MATNTSAADLNPRARHRVRLVEAQRLRNPISREAAELIAAEVLNPVLRSRGKTRTEALQQSRDDKFCEDMEVLFKGHPTGQLLIPTFEDAIRPAGSS